jgi:predicted nuclease with TOPRIM domain
MSTVTPDSVIEVLGILALAVIAVLIGVQKLLKDWKSTSAETSIITLMHTELDRMAQQNTALSIELGRLHNEVIALNGQLQKLTIENQRLQAEVVSLTREVTRLQAVLYKGDLDDVTN